MVLQLQHLKCSCGQRWTENVVGRDELISVQSVERMFRHFRKKGHKPIIKRFWWLSEPKELLEGVYP